MLTQLRANDLASLFIFLSLLLSSCKPAPESLGPGGLVWPEPLVEIHLKPGESQRKIEFQVRNRGENPEIIESVSSDCGCLLGDSSGLEITPGAEMTLPMTFRANALMGGTTVEKIVKVRVHGHEPHAALTFRAHVPAMVKVTPARLEWTGVDLSWKEVTLESPIRFDLLQTRASNTGFQWEVMPINSTKSTIKIKVRPLEVTAKMSLLTLETTLPDPWSKTSVLLHTKTPVQ